MLPHVSYGSHLGSLFELLYTLHVAHCKPLIMCQVSCITLGASKNMKFQLSRNSTKFDVVARFHKTIPTVSPLRHLKSRKNLDFPTEITILPFLRKIEFSRVVHSSPLKRISSQNSTHIHIESHAYFTTHNHMYTD